jgi:hypothetical protein
VLALDEELATMSVAASVALAVAERVERTGGPRAGLVAWRTLAGNAADGEVRGRALLSALRCALALRDGDAVSELTLLWGTVDRGVWDGPIAALCKEMVRTGDLARAVALAHAETHRHRTARSLYCYARCLDVARDPGAPSAFRDAIARAENEGATEIELAARVRRASILARSWLTLGEALEEARLVDVTKVPPASRLEVARVLLRSPSRFTRAAAIDTLDAIVAGDDPRLAMRALSLVARWADDAGDALTPLEADRLVALLARERATKVAPRAKDAARSVERIARAQGDAMLTIALDEASRHAPELAAVHERARDVVRGRFEAPTSRTDAPPPIGTSARFAHRWSGLLDVAVAIRDRRPARAAHALRLLAEAEEAGEHLPVAALGIAEAALAFDDVELREVATRLIGVWLRSARSGAPPGGYAALAETLASLGQTELSQLARHAAVVAKEPGAAESLGTALVREGWELAKAGDRPKAIARLREAKALLA